MSFNALSGLSCYGRTSGSYWHRGCFNALSGLSCYVNAFNSSSESLVFQCPLGLELLRMEMLLFRLTIAFQCPLGLELLRDHGDGTANLVVSFNALSGLSCYEEHCKLSDNHRRVSMPSRA